MAKRSFRGRVGRGRISGGDTSSNARFTRNIRAAMKEVEGLISKTINELDGITTDVLLDAMEPTFDKVIKYTPVDSGKLIESLALDIDASGKVVKASISAGNGNEVDYAVFVHERLDQNHQSPTRAKFIQSALEEDVDAIKKRLIEGYKSKVKGK